MTPTTTDRADRLRRSSARRKDDRETSGASDFDAALDAYQHGGNPEDLLCASGLVIDCTIPIDPEHARAVESLTGSAYEIFDYDDAGRAYQGLLPA
jgi:hypothetical protein